MHQDFWSQGKRITYFLYVVSLIVGLLIVTPKSHALTTPPGPTESLVDSLKWQANDKITLGSLSHVTLEALPVSNSFRDILFRQQSAFGTYLKRFQSHGFSAVVQKYFRDVGIHPSIQIKSTDVSALGLGLTSGAQTMPTGRSFDHRFFVNGYPLCDLQARSHLLSDGSGLLMGEIPSLKDLDIWSHIDEWPNLDHTKARLEQTMLLDQSSENTQDQEDGHEANRWINSEQCYLTKNNNLIPVWKLIVRVNGALYNIIADANEIYRFQPYFFSVDGKAKTWAHNRSTDPNTDRILYGLSGDGTLTSEFLRTVVPTEINRAKEDSHVFNYPVSDRRIEEVTAYANAQDHLRWFQGLGFTWYGVKPLEVRVHFKPQNKPNNALFEPGDDTANIPPTITIDDGDGVELQNLVTDGDVVSHELGHHILFKTLKNVSGESLVLHEGLSDYFVFARTGDPCLGETICPAESGQCQQKAKCLRSAANRLVYKDEVWQGFSAGRSNQLGHLHGQLISGMMWDMRSSNQFPGNDLPLLVMKAASFFAESSNFCQYIRALYAADKELFGGKHLELIKFVAQERGLGEFTDPAKDCPVGSLKNPEQNVQMSENNKSKAKVKCGAVEHGSASDGRAAWNLVLILIFPLILLAKRSLNASSKKQILLTQRSHPKKVRAAHLNRYLIIFLTISANIPETGHAELPKAIKQESAIKTPTYSDATMTISLLLHWEGRPLAPENITAMESFRKQFPNIDIVHLISPAYFSRSNEEYTQIQSALGKLVSTQDYYGVLLGSWKSIMTQAGVIFRSNPTFWGTSLTKGQCQISDCGVDIPLHLYPQQDIEKIMKYSIDTLEKKGLGRPMSFGVTGWVSSPAIIDTASRLGLIYDFSPVAPESLLTTINYYPLYSWVKSLWDHIKLDSLPSFRQTSYGRILLYPQNLAAIDHNPPGVLTARVKHSIETWNDKKSPPQNKNINLPIVMYIETAEDSLSKLQTDLAEALRLAEQHKIRVLKQTFANINVPRSPAFVAAKTDKNDKMEPSKSPPAATVPPKNEAH